MNGLDLFSGIGGLAQGLKEWVRPVAYCETDRHCQGVLMSRMQAKDLDRAPIWDDVRTLRGRDFEVPVDIIYGGFPCQDISTAGSGAGLEGSRSGLFFEIIRLTRELRPRFVFLENVPAITVRGLSRILLELAAMGFDCRWTIVSAAEMGAAHRRERWFLLAHSNGEPMRLSESGRRLEEIHASRALEARQASDAAGVGPQENKQSRIQSDAFGLSLLEGNNWNDYARFFHRVDHGLPFRTHRLKGLGNAVVPAQAREAFMRLSGLK